MLECRPIADRGCSSCHQPPNAEALSYYQLSLRQKFVLAVIFVVFGFIVPLSIASATTTSSRFVQDRFAIGFWVDPPSGDQMEARYKEIADANFTFALGVFGATTLTNMAQQLAYCEKYGLKAIVSQAGLPANQLPTNSVCWGYFLVDEPGPGSFPALKRDVDAIHDARPGRVAFINLYPNWVPTNAIGMSYTAFVTKFMDEVRPDVLSMDHYPHFLPHDDGRPVYCANLEIMRAESLAAGIPFWNFFNTMPYGDHSDPTEAQLRWQIYTSIAYGAKGVMYFCYWTPVGDEFPKGGAIITRQGKRTRHYEEAKRINAAIKNLGPTLMKLTSISVIHVDPKADIASLLKGTPIRTVTPGDYLVGVFKHADGRRAILLNNYHFAYSAWPTVTFDRDPSQVLEVSPVDGKERPVEDDSPDMPGLQISLDAGQGRLFLLPP
jgi:hypothetical protein